MNCHRGPGRPLRIEFFYKMKGQAEWQERSDD
jgi:hypothetical protein